MNIAASARLLKKLCYCFPCDNGATHQLNHTEKINDSTKLTTVYGYCEDHANYRKHSRPYSHFGPITKSALTRFK